MKFIPLILSCLCYLYGIGGVFAQESFTIKGNLDGYNAKAKIFLSIKNIVHPLLDSATLVNGQFKFQGNINEPAIASVFISPEGKSLDQLDIIAEHDGLEIGISRGLIKINGKKLAEAEISGTKVSRQFDEFNRSMTHNQVSRRSATPQTLSAVSQFIEKYPNNYLSLRILQDINLSSDTTKFLRHQFERLSPKLQNTPRGQHLKDRIHKINSLMVGNMSPDFSLPDTSGNIISLTNFRGKYVLLDFWASWCIPCREENPNLKRAFEQFSQKNFTIMGVSIDNGKSPWQEAIAEDQIQYWTHLFNVKNSENDLVDIYDVQRIPKNYLIDPEGKIIAIDLRGDELFKFLAKTLD